MDESDSFFMEDRQLGRDSFVGACTTIVPAMLLGVSSSLDGA